MPRNVDIPSSYRHRRNATLTLLTQTQAASNGLEARVSLFRLGSFSALEIVEHASNPAPLKVSDTNISLYLGAAVTQIRSSQ